MSIYSGPNSVNPLGIVDPSSFAAPSKTYGLLWDLETIDEIFPDDHWFFSLGEQQPATSGGSERSHQIST